MVADHRPGTVTDFVTKRKADGPARRRVDWPWPSLSIWNDRAPTGWAASRAGLEGLDLHGPQVLRTFATWQEANLRCWVELRGFEP